MKIMGTPFGNFGTICPNGIALHQIPILIEINAAGAGLRDALLWRYGRLE
jgi:hypothetical protein